jgi:hypothetical protein
MSDCACFVGDAGATCSTDAGVDSPPSVDAGIACPGVAACAAQDYCLIETGGALPPCLPRTDAGVCPPGTQMGCPFNDPNGCSVVQTPVGICRSLVGCTPADPCACLCGFGWACSLTGHVLNCQGA